jgi:hypothetical protein
MARRKSAVVKATAAVFRASHAVPLVGFLIAALFGVGWWRLRRSPSAPFRGLAVGLGLIALFFAIVAVIGFALIVLERLGGGRAGGRDRRRGHGRR